MLAIEDKEGPVGIDSLEQLVRNTEAAARSGQGLDLSSKLATDLVKILPSLEVSDALRLKHLGRELWKVCGNFSTSRVPLPESTKVSLARAREISCEFTQSGMDRAGSWCSNDQHTVISQWAVAGKAFLDIGYFEDGLRCLVRSTAAREVYQEDIAKKDPEDRERFDEVTLQHALWTATAETHLERYSEALTSLQKAAALAQAWPRLAVVSHGLLMRAYKEQANLLRARGKTKLTADVLALACRALAPATAKGVPRDPEKAELLRQLALCRCELQDAEGAVASAREAVSLETPKSASQARSLRVLLAALCLGIEKGGEEEGLRRAETERVALEFIQHGRAVEKQCFEVCQDLWDQRLDALALKCLSLLSRRLENDPQKLAFSWLLGVQLLIGRVEELASGDIEMDGAQGRCSQAEIGDALCTLLGKIESNKQAASIPNLAARLASLLMRLAEAVSRKGYPHAAQQWLFKAMPFLEIERRSAIGWRVLALCHRSAGEAHQARQAADTALNLDPTDAHAASLILLDAVEKGEEEVANSILARSAKGDLNVSTVQVAYVVSELGTKGQESPLGLKCLQLLLQRVSKDPDIGTGVGVDVARVLRRVLEVAEALGEASASLAERLKAAAYLDVLSPHQVKWFVDFAWRKGVKMVDAGCWSESVALFEGAHTLLSCNGSASSTTAARCASALVDTLLRQAKATTDPSEVGRLCGRAIGWADKGRNDLGLSRAPGEDEAAFKKCHVELARLQFEAVCLSRVARRVFSTEQREAPLSLLKAAAPDLRGVALLALIAFEAQDQQGICECLSEYLSRSAAEGKSEKAAAAKRELHRLGFEDTSCLRKAVKEATESPVLDEEDAGTQMDHNCLPQAEALWLVVTGWNQGVEGWESGAGSEAESWLQAALELLAVTAGRAGGISVKVHQELMGSWDRYQKGKPRDCGGQSPS